MPQPCRDQIRPRDQLHEPKSYVRPSCRGSAGASPSQMSRTLTAPRKNVMRH